MRESFETRSVNALRRLKEGDFTEDEARLFIKAAADSFLSQLAEEVEENQENDFSIARVKAGAIIRKYIK